MPSEIRDPKTLAEWAELDFHSRHRGMRLWRGKLTWWVLVGLSVLVGGAIAANLVLHRGSTIFESGPLVQAHAMFQDDCSRCHTTPFQTALRFSPLHSQAPTVPDSACSACHPGPAHNAMLVGEQHCAECHREHRGRATLAQVPDLNCTNCHEDLKKHHKDFAKSRFAEKVTAFPDDHPEFAVWRGTDPAFPKSKDPGKLKFNHKMHLDPDGVFVPERGKPDSTRREVLDCSSCHQLDDSGRYMKPINHLSHCARCHEGQRNVRLAGMFLTADLAKAADDFAVTPALHAPPTDIRDRLNGRMLAFLTDHPLDKGNGDKVDRPWVRPTNEMIWEPLTTPMASYQRQRFMPPQLARMERMLYDRQGGCAFCHVADPEKPHTGLWVESERPLDQLPVYLPTRGDRPKRWFSLAMFNHEHHRREPATGQTLECTVCHQAKESTETSDILLPKMAVCGTCHSPKGGARFDCAECHKYHGRSDPAAAHSGPALDRSEEKASRAA